MKVEGKTIVVTGGANGMGRELVLKLLEKGARVAAVDINQETLDETAALVGDHQGRLSTHTLDLTDLEAVSRLPREVIRLHNEVDGIINNAGIIQRFVRVNDLEIPEMERVFNINFWGVVYMVKAFLPHLLERPEAHIVNISSMGGFLPVPGQTIYGASKAAVKLFTDGLHSELLDTNVRVTGVFPGATETNISENSGVTMAVDESSDRRSSIRMTKADDAAEIILDGMEKDRYHVYVGSDARMMNVMVRTSPKRAAKLIYSQMRDLLP